MSTVVSYILSMVVPLALRTGMYYGVFRWRAIPATLVSCVVIGGSAILVSFLPLSFIPAPIAIIALASYLCSKYTTTRWFPEALMIAGGVEIISHLLLRYIIFPLMS